MATVESSIDVHVPISVAYNQWTQFEEFPSFMTTASFPGDGRAKRRA
jgi:uncharacterized membrane protein